MKNNSNFFQNAFNFIKNTRGFICILILILSVVSLIYGYSKYDLITEGLFLAGIIHAGHVILRKRSVGAYIWVALWQLLMSAYLMRMCGIIVGLPLSIFLPILYWMVIFTTPICGKPAVIPATTTDTETNASTGAQMKCSFEGTEDQMAKFGKSLNEAFKSEKKSKVHMTESARIPLIRVRNPFLKYTVEDKIIIKAPTLFGDRDPFKFSAIYDLKTSNKLYRVIFGCSVLKIKVTKVHDDSWMYWYGLPCKLADKIEELWKEK